MKFKNDFQVMYNHLDALIKMKAVKPVIGKVYPIEDADKAQNDVINNNGTHGRLTLKL